MPWPTNLYPKILYSTSRQVEAAEAVVSAPGQEQQTAMRNVSGSGRTETLVIRREETRQLVFPVNGSLELESWRRYALDWGQHGRQAELMACRHQGAALTFANTITDQANGLPCSYGLPSSWSVRNGKVGLEVPGSGTLTVGNPAGSLSAALTASGGVVTMAFVPRFPANTGSMETFFDTVSTGGGSLRLYKSGSFQVDFEVTFQTGSKATARWDAASWTANADAVMLIGRYSQVGSPVLWFGVGGVLRQSSLYAESMVGSLGTLANTVTLHGDRSNAEYAAGVLLHAATYRWAYDDPTILSSYFLDGRNYYPTAELMDAAWAPARTSPSVDVWQVALNFRKGQ